VAERGLSVRETERLVQSGGNSAPPSRKAGPRLDADGRRLEEELSEALAAKVQLKPRRGGKGALVIDYGSLDELQGLVKRLRRP
jgi:ParB family transcriptional regulator, chromosome partitioning protein